MRFFLGLRDLDPSILALKFRHNVAVLDAQRTCVVYKRELFLPVTSYDNTINYKLIIMCLPRDWLSLGEVHVQSSKRPGDDGL